MDKMHQIIEIVPDDMPQWAWDAFDSGQFFRICVQKVEDLETLVNKLKQEPSTDG